MTLKEDILTNRLILYRPRTEHLSAVYEIHADPRTNVFNPRGAIDDVGEASAMLVHWQSEWEEKQWGYWTIALNAAPDRIIGVGGISSRPRFGGHGLVERLHRQQAANLYFRLRPEAWGSGYANEMANAALNLAFQQIGLQAVLGLTRETNTSSRRVLERLGMTMVETGSPDHELGAQVVYAIDAATYSKQTS